MGRAFRVLVAVVALGVSALEALWPVAPAVAQPPSIQSQPATPPPAPPPAPPVEVPPARACQTQWGVCLIPCCVQPGTPCACTGPNNVQLPGYAVQYFRPFP